MSSPVRTLQKRIMKRAGMARRDVYQGFNIITGLPIVRRLITDRDGKTIFGPHWPRLIPAAIAMRPRAVTA
jgi:hypothetical protein